MDDKPIRISDAWRPKWRSGALGVARFLTLLLALAGLIPPATAQNALLVSLAGEEAARARREAASSVGYYNVKVGPTGWRFGSGLGVEFDDNVRLEENGESDVIFTPQATVAMLWPVTEQNALNLTVGLGYDAHVIHPELSQFYITPSSALSFDLYAGDFLINFHDTFSINQNSYQDPTVTGTGNYALFQNDAGISTIWDLNKAKLQLGYDHINYVVLSGGQGRPDGYSDLLSLSGGYVSKPGVLIGVEAGGGFVRYDANTGNGGTNVSSSFPDASQWSIGAFYDTQASRYLRARLGFGYTVYMPEASAGFPNSGNFTGYYGYVNINHKISRYISYSLDFGRGINFGYFGGTVDNYFATAAADWNLIRNTTLSLRFDFNHGKDVNSGGETFNRAGPGLTLGRSLSPKLLASLMYQFYWRDSNQPNRSYTVNIVSLNLTYTF